MGSSTGRMESRLHPTVASMLQTKTTAASRSSPQMEYSLPNGAQRVRATGRFLFTTGVAVAPDGSVYVGDRAHHRFQKFKVGP